MVSCTEHFCYYRTSKKTSWTEAVNECRRFNADLVSIHSQDDQDWIITNILIPQSLDEMYIGMNMKFHLLVIPFSSNHVYRHFPPGKTSRRAQNNGRSMVSVQPKVRVDWSRSNLVGDFDRSHMINISPRAHCRNKW